MSVNKVILVGNLGANPDCRSLPSGAMNCNLSIATTEVRKNRETSEKTERTEWHRVVMYYRLAEIAQQYLSKGAKVYIEGKLRTNKWQDSSGNDRYSTEIIADNMQMLGRAGGGESNDNSNTNKDKTQNNSAPPKDPAANNSAKQQDYDNFDDDIPF